MTPTKTEIKVANKLINMLKKAGYTDPDDMLRVIRLAREKYEAMKAKDSS